MEKEELFSNGDSTMFPDFGMEIHSNYGSEQLPNCYFNPNWGNPMDQSDPFESALSSMVSSPAASNAAAAATGVGGGGGDGVVLRELIGRLGSICNSGEISPHSFINGNNSANTSCYSTPLNSPPKLNLSMMDQQIRTNFTNQGYHFPSSFTPLSTDPGFVERAARFSCFGTRNLGLNESALPNRLVPTMESGKLSRVSSNKSIRIAGSPMGLQGDKDGKFSKLSRSSSPENGEESSSVSEQIPNAEMGMKSQTQSEENTSRKRKSIPRGKGKETKSPSPSKTDPPELAGENDESNIKRSKPDEATGNGKVEKGKSGAKPPSPAEPPKDYIHVRARRGQATDSHSLAERVRRERISERMKYLQDLVPGCNKVTGKAVMLDEIINYVQSLQRQVEFLSMKLATVNPRMDFNTEAARLSKDDTRGSIPHNIFPLETNTFPHGYQSSMAPFSSALQRNPSTQLPPMDAFSEAASQASAFWEDDLLSFVQMGFGQNQPQNFHAGSGTGKMKVEL